MPTIKCPKCGEAQSSGNTECIRCGVVFKKVSSRPKEQNINPRQPESAPPKILTPQKEFMPQIGMRSHAEITILNLLTYLYLIFGIASGVSLMIGGENLLSIGIGLLVILQVLVFCMVFFIICTVAKKIISIDSNVSSIADLLRSK